MLDADAIADHEPGVAQSHALLGNGGVAYGMNADSFAELGTLAYDYGVMTSEGSACAAACDAEFGGGC